MKPNWELIFVLFSTSIFWLFVLLFLIVEFGMY
jgi:hypothetical protein